LNLDAAARDCMAGQMDKTRDRVLDELLVTRCQEGSRESFDLLIRRWQRPLWRYARRVTGDDDDAWDVMQETWIAILSQIRRLSDPAWFPAWAFRIARNKCADYIRRASRQRHAVVALTEQQRSKEDPPLQSPDNTVAEAVRRMSPGERELLALKYGQDLSIIEIAIVLGIPTGTVKSRLHRAREGLRRILEGDES